MEGSQTHLMQEGVVDFGLQVDKAKKNSSKCKATSIPCVYDIDTYKMIVNMLCNYIKIYLVYN